MIVVDASLATKWILWEDDTRLAMRFLFHNGGQFCAPDTLFTEVGHAIIRHANVTKSRGQDITEDALETLSKWTVSWSRHIVKPYRVTQRRLYEAGRLALGLGHPLPDCIYLTLAIELGCTLATCDAKFRTKALSIHDDVRMLAEFELPPHPALRES